MLKRLVFNRLSIALAVMAAIVMAWNGYVSFHDDGILTGQVVGTDGAPVPGAAVTLYMPGIVGIDVIEIRHTDAAGMFRFDKHGQHHPAAQAVAEGIGKSDLVNVRLYFRNQNHRLEAPLRLERGG